MPNRQGAGSTSPNEKLGGQDECPMDKNRGDAAENVACRTLELQLSGRGN
ncbi:MAG: hypothetical protein RBU37_00610 [Myxococcota bacterium]|nr:hypothetical protein [Myxococcota bacterium]